MLLRGPSQRPATRLWAIAGLMGAFLLAGLSARLPAAQSTDVTAAGTYNWLQFDGDSQHSGNNSAESFLTSANLADVSQSFQVSLPSNADGAPVYLAGVSTSSGPRDLLFVTTTDGHLVALDAHAGQQIWSKQYAAGSCKINNGSSTCYTTSSPVVDPGLQYVYGYGLDGNVHKFQVSDGTEITGGGWPEVATIKDFDEKGSAALSLATASNGTSYLYVTNSGYPGDNGNYQGHVTAINLATGAQNVFNSLCSNLTIHFPDSGSTDCSHVQSGMWSRASAVYLAADNRIYLSTGNGDYSPGSFDWGDSVFALNPDGTGQTGSPGGNPVDSYTPTNFASLQSSDADLGSTNVAILPVPATSTVQHLGLQGGKDAVLRLLNLDNLSGTGGPGHTGGEITTLTVPQGGEILTQPAVWVDGSGTTWIFIANGNGTAGLQLTVTNGQPGLKTIWQNSTGGTSPIVANGVVYEAAFNNTVRALNPTNGALIWHGTIGGIHWNSPIVANGVIYVTDQSSHLTAFALMLDNSLYLPILGNLRDAAKSGYDPRVPGRRMYR